MRKLYVVCTTGIILIIIVHMFYMVAGISDGVTINKDLAMNMGFMLMVLAILHGIYGLVKLVKVLENSLKAKKCCQRKCIYVAVQIALFQLKT